MFLQTAKKQRRDLRWRESLPLLHFLPFSQTDNASCGQMGLLADVAGPLLESLAVHQCGRMG